MLKKIYQEERGSTFESEGVIYDLNAIFIDTARLPVNQISPRRLEWAIGKDLDPKRVDAADTSIPVLVMIYNYKGQPKLLVVDGEHRTAKALKNKLAIMPYKLVPAAIMKKNIIKKGK